MWVEFWGWQVFFFANFFSFLLLWFYQIGTLVARVLKLLPLLILFLLSYILRLYSVCNSQTVNRIFAKSITQMIYTHPVIEICVCLQSAQIVCIIRIGVRHCMCEVNNILVVLEFILKGECAQVFYRCCLQLLTCLTLQKFDIHNFDLTALSTTILLVSYIPACPMPPLPSLKVPLLAKNQRLHSIAERWVGFCHVDNIEFDVSPGFYVHNAEIKPLGTRSIWMSIIL